MIIWEYLFNSDNLLLLFYCIFDILNEIFLMGIFIVKYRFYGVHTTDDSLYIYHFDFFVQVDFM